MGAKRVGEGKNRGGEDRDVLKIPLKSSGPALSLTFETYDEVSGRN